MTKPKSEFAKQLDTIQAAVHSFLKPSGFRKKGRTHNRDTKGGLVHVVSFQMGQYPIGDNYVVPGLRESFYGKFAINLGVLLPCVYEVERQRPRPDFVQEYDCTIRERLGMLAFRNDTWFEITSDTAMVAARAVDLLDRFGLDFFEPFQTYDEVLSYYNLHGAFPFQNAGRASLEAALVAHHMGNRGLSATLFTKANATDHKGFKEHVSTLAKRLGLTIS